MMQSLINTEIVAAGGEVPPFFMLLTLVFGSVVVISLILTKLKQSLLVGYFLCGLVIANSGVLQTFGLEDTKYISALSELGIVLLLFTLGIEFSVKELIRMKRTIFLGGGIQIGVTALVTTVAVMLMNLPLAHALILGGVVALSSTAVSIKSFQDMMMSETPQAKVTLGVAIAQDLVAILFMVMIPVLAGEAGVSGFPLAMALGKGVLFTLSILVLSRYGFPQMLDAVARTRSRELFTITVVGLCGAVALLSGVLGLSPALGAFAAGGLAAGAMLFLNQRSGLKEDTIIGLIFTSFFGLGLFMVSLSPTSVSIQTITMGNILAITPSDTIQLAIIGFVTLAILLAKWKDLMVTFFDENHARAIGLRPGLLKAVFFILLSASVVAAMQTVGAFLVIAMVVTPGATAYLLCDRFPRLIATSVIIGSVTSFSGAYISYFLDGATGGVIVSLQTLIFLIAFVFAPKHGLLVAKRKARIALRDGPGAVL